MEAINQLLKDQVGEVCYNSVLVNGILGSGCTSFVLSKVIGLLITVISSMIKLPQLIKMVTNGSAKGVNRVSLTIETLALTIIVCFCKMNNQAFTTYGDATFVLAQNVCLMLLVLYFEGSIVNILGFSAAYLALNYCLYNVLSFTVLTSLMVALLPMMLVGFIPQLLQNYKEKSIGQLSKTTIILQFFTAYGRVFTNYIEVDQVLAMVGSSMGAILQTFLLYQALVYTGVSKPSSETKVKKQN